MNSELTNLLSPSAVRALRRTYFLRLSAIAVGMLTAVLIVHGVLLVPSYVRAHEEVTRQQVELERLTKQAAASQEGEAGARIKALQADTAYLGRLQKLPTASGAVRAVLAVPHPGISLTGFTYTAPVKEGAEAQMAVSGTASTRDALRQYALSLGDLPYVSKADLPISAYAKETQIPFTITLTGTLLP